MDSNEGTKTYSIWSFNMHNPEDTMLNIGDKVMNLTNIVYIKGRSKGLLLIQHKQLQIKHIQLVHYLIIRSVNIYPHKSIK